MAQNSPPAICPKCGTRAEPGQRFCSECGSTLNIDVNKPTEFASGDAFATMPAAQPSQPDATIITPQSQPAPAPSIPASSYASLPASQFYNATTDANVIPPPPPPDSYVSLPQVAPQSQPTPAPSSPSLPGTFAPVPEYAKKPKRSRGCLITSIMLLLVLAIGGTALYLGVIRPRIGNNGNSQQTPPSQQQTQTANTPTSTGTTPTTGTTPATTPSSGTTATTSEQVNLTFVYSDVTYALSSVEYAPSYIDDASLSSGGVRVAFKESNQSSNSIIFSYSEVARLILPDGTAVAPSNELHYGAPSTQSSDNNWIDFPVSSQPSDLSKLELVMGLTTENQMKIPLSPGADLSQYQPKTSSPNASFSYSGLNWTLTQAIVSYSAQGQQATAGNIYVVITLQVVNNSGNNFIDSPSSYMRLQAGGTTNAPVGNATLPSSFAPQTSGQGTVTFLAPQGGTTYTLMMLAQQGTPPIQAVSQNFQVP